jgi:hypothetical protein
MKKKALAFITLTALMTTASSTWATSYTYTFSGEELMSYVKASGPAGSTAADLGIYNGAMRYTFATDSGTGSWSSWLAGTSGLFKDWANDTSSRLTMFNLWGYGDYQTANATDWGEQFKVTSWTKGQADKNWISQLLQDAGTLDKEVLAFGSITGYYNALSFNGSDYPTFSFTLDLDDNTTPWYQGVKGQLVFWYGGDMVNADDIYRGNLQGNMVLAGEASTVPEPTTMLLFGVGLVGLAAKTRKKAKKSK